MASPEIIGRGIIALHEAFPSREVTERTAELWIRMFRNVTDEQFTRAVEEVLADPKREFFPAPGVLIGIIRGPAPVLDLPAVVRRIESLGHYTPTSGWIWPRVDIVRETLGDAVATAYGQVGFRLGADDETTRSIAFRDFTAEITALLERDGEKALNGTEQPPRIGGTPQLKLVSGDKP